MIEMDGELSGVTASVRVRPDIADREERDQWVLGLASTVFQERGMLMRTLVLRTRAPHELVIVSYSLPENLAHAGGAFATAAAQCFKAQQLYLAFEMWWALATPEELERGARADQMDNRREGLLVSSEDPYSTPPLRAWQAEITRDAQDKATLGPWQRPEWTKSSGRLAYVLPPEAYAAAGAKVPSV